MRWFYIYWLVSGFITVIWEREMIKTIQETWWKNLYAWVGPTIIILSGMLLGFIRLPILIIMNTWLFFLVRKRKRFETELERKEGVNKALEDLYKKLDKK